MDESEFANNKPPSESRDDSSKLHARHVQDCSLKLNQSLRGAAWRRELVNWTSPDQRHRTAHVHAEHCGERSSYWEKVHAGRSKLAKDLYSMMSKSNPRSMKNQCKSEQYVHELMIWGLGWASGVKQTTTFDFLGWV